jgi:hypothetical protein
VPATNPGCPGSGGPAGGGEALAVALDVADGDGSTVSDGVGVGEATTAVGEAAVATADAGGVAAADGAALAG